MHARNLGGLKVRDTVVSCSALWWGNRGRTCVVGEVVKCVRAIVGSHKERGEIRGGGRVNMLLVDYMGDWLAGVKQVAYIWGWFSARRVGGGEVAEWQERSVCGGGSSCACFWVFDRLVDRVVGLFGSINVNISIHKWRG